MTTVTKEMYDGVIAELASFKQKYSKMATDYQSLEDQVKIYKSKADSVKTAVIPPEVPTLASLQLQLNERKQDALSSARSIARWSGGKLE